MKGFFEGFGLQVDMCPGCGLFKNCANPKLPGVGSTETGGVLIVEPAPTKRDDSRGRLSLADDHREFVIGALPDSLQGMVHWTCAVQCGGHKPQNENFRACENRLHKTITTLKPWLIIALGPQAFRSVLGEENYQPEKDGAWEGYIVPVHSIGAYCICVPNPVYFYKGENAWDTVSGVHFKKLLQNVHMIPKMPPPVHIEVVYVSMKDVGTVLNSLDKSYMWSIDFETTGLKPDRDGHKIICAAVSNGEVSYTFPVMEDPDVVQSLGKFMGSSLKKCAHNIKFESTWSRVTLGVTPRNMVHCSMTAAHILDNRKGVTNLKFCAAVMFGIFNYDREIVPFIDSDSIESEKYGANGFNRLALVPLKTLLKYCAWDSFFGWHLATLQMQRMGL